MGRRLQWRGAKPEWPRGPLQWFLCVIGLLESGVFLAFMTRIDDLATVTVINLIWFGSLLLLAILYRLAAPQPAA